MEFNPATAALQPSGIREIMHVAARREGVVRLDIGDPDFPTPPHVIEAARLAPSGYAL
ncbi:hypothetical protein [Bounagaea algeriensis]